MSSQKPKRLTVTARNLTVKVNSVGEDYGETIASVVDIRRVAALFGGSKNVQQRAILKDITVQVRPAEMCLVLGRPGAGCTSLLKVLANETKTFPSVEGDVTFGSMAAVDARQLRHQTLFNSEEDMHFPTLTVSEAIRFATSTKVPSERPEELEDREIYVKHMEDAILSSLGISHTKGTLVGNEYVRGVSGGERKRVSIAEVLAGGSPLQCWDQSTRGLDASTALDFVRILRLSADEQSKSIVATFYQAGNDIFDQFDKVVVLCEGSEIFYGPKSLAKGYFEEMGFVCAPGANVADFLTSVAVPTERTIRSGFEHLVPLRPEEFEARYKASSVYQSMLDKISDVSRSELFAETENLQAAVSAEKSRSMPVFSGGSSPYTVSLYRQTIACTKRQFQIMMGDQLSNVLKLVSSLIQALVCGSLFFNMSEDSSSVFTRPGALFFPILYYALCSLSETTASFMGRPILARHKQFGFYRPTAFTLACVIADIPIVIFNMTLFNIVFYFMVNFKLNAAKWFTNWIILVAVTLCFTSFFRMIGAACKRFGLASQIAGWSLMAMMIYAGYLIPFESMHVWLRWISYINPAFYAFEAVMGAEFGGRVLDCVEPQYIPYGAGYTDGAYRSCTVIGTSTGSDFVNGQSYIDAQYHYSEHHIWRNLGIICAFWIFFVFMTAIGFEAAESEAGASRNLLKRGSRRHHDPNTRDEEKANNSSSSSTIQSQGQQGFNGLAKQSVFTFKNLDYFVNYHGSELQLLRKVNGYVKPGQLVALMGTSGAGKTTLMDVLSQRKDSGRIEGSILVDGLPQSVSFQRTTGYCEQNDVHEATATVRESLLFSARLRQSYEVPDVEKVEYVETIIDLLELVDIQDALVGIPGAGLSIEQRKRLTLGVELVTKPSILFLDEPTSGLDGQSAFNIVRFMRRLAQAGQAIVCTIHQPSATLFEAFDVLLLLAKGGRTTYFGETGENSATLLEYFARQGASCPTDTNPAEYMIDAVQGKFGDHVDWPQRWLEAPESQEALAEIDKLNSLSVKADPKLAVDTRSFATPKMHQIKLVTERQLISLWRNPDYVWNKILLHVFASLFAGFTFWMIGDGTFDLQLRLFTVFNFVFVAPGVINQLQPLFLHNREIFETREKKSKTYHWVAFISAQLISEIPVLIVCGTLYFCCWYFTAGMPVKASASGQVYLEMLLYEFLYTAIGQAIATYSPNAYFAALANPIFIGAGLINFCGIAVPYSQIQSFWRYWIYYLDPFTYLVGALLEPILWDVNVTCKPSELTTIPLPDSTTCGTYMESFLASHAGYVVDAANATFCEYCPFSTGADYAKTFNINERYYGWRDVGITALFCFSSYAMVFGMMKLRSKETKTAG